MKFFAAWHKDPAVVRESTSGGVFTALAEHVLARNGIVVGVAYNADLSISHILVEDVKELARIRGVKYAFAPISKEIFDGIGRALLSGRQVLFTGTPCQAAAIRKRFGMDKNLLIVDLVCFGAPDQRFWLKYVRWLENKFGKKLHSINPRDKKHGWGRKTYYAYKWEGGSVTRKLSVFDPYAQAFYSTLSFRDCCFKCPYRGINHQSDLTIGDCWGADVLADFEIQASCGVSLVVSHSESGLSAFADSMCKYVEIDEKMVRANNSPYYDSPSPRDDHKQFIEDAEGLPFEELSKKYRLETSWRAWMRSQTKSFIKRLVRR